MAGLYIHVPFCVRKCPYCDFYSVPVDSARDLVKVYIEALETELSHLPVGFRADTVYVGGGTPTSLSPRALEHLLDAVRRAAPSATEWSLEANPGTIDTEKAQLLRRVGITRVSLGAQSLNDEILRRLGRIHTADDTRRAYEILRSANVKNVGLDIMYGVPGQTVKMVERDLREIVPWRPEHISCYALAFEPGTDYELLRQAGRLREVSADVQRAQYDRIRRVLRDAGYEHYEISNFARPGHECRHNISYWLGDEYIGCGPAAHSHWRGVRWANVRDAAEWAQRVRQGQPAREFEEQLAPEAKARETLILNLRLLKGVARETFRARTGFDYYDLTGPAIRRLLAEGWLVEERDVLRLAERALFVSNAVLRELV